MVLTVFIFGSQKKKTDFSLIGANGVNGSLFVPSNAHTQLTEYTLLTAFLSLSHTHSAKASIFSLIGERQKKKLLSHTDRWIQLTPEKEYSKGKKRKRRCNAQLLLKLRKF
jgi:hypothetical protein